MIEHPKRGPSPGVYFQIACLCIDREIVGDVIKGRRRVGDEVQIFYNLQNLVGKVHCSDSADSVNGLNFV